MTLVLRISQFLGYFPRSLNSSRILPRKYKWIRFLYFIPILFHCLLVAVNIFMVAISIKMQRQEIHSPKNPGTASASVQVSFVTTMKATCHIFTTVYIKVAILLKGAQLSKFCSEFEELVTSSNQLVVHNFKKKCENRFHPKFWMELFAWMIACTVFIGDMWDVFLLNENRSAASKLICKYIFFWFIHF